MARDMPWLFQRATVRSGQAGQGDSPGQYDADLQLLVVSEGGGAVVPAIDSEQPPATKKADIEKGEDQKDRWA
jgi:hypothetical protein